MGNIINGKIEVSQEVATAINERLSEVTAGTIMDCSSRNRYMLPKYKCLNSNNIPLDDLYHALYKGFVVEKPKYKKEDLQFRMNIKDLYDNELTVINQVGYDLYSVTMIEYKLVYTVMITEEELLNNLNSGDWILQ